PTPPRLASARAEFRASCAWSRFGLGARSRPTPRLVQGCGGFELRVSAPRGSALFRGMSTTPPQSDWPTQVQEPRTTIVESRVPAGEPVPPTFDPSRGAFPDFGPRLAGLSLLAVAGLVALWWFQYH